MPLSAIKNNNGDRHEPNGSRDDECVSPSAEFFCGGYFFVGGGRDNRDRRVKVK